MDNIHGVVIQFPDPFHASSLYELKRVICAHYHPNLSAGDIEFELFQIESSPRRLWGTHLITVIYRTRGMWMTRSAWRQTFHFRLDLYSTSSGVLYTQSRKRIRYPD